MKTQWIKDAYDDFISVDAVRRFYVLSATFEGNTAVLLAEHSASRDFTLAKYPSVEIARTALKMLMWQVSSGISIILPPDEADVLNEMQIKAAEEHAKAIKREEVAARLARIRTGMPPDEEQPDPFEDA